MTETMLALRQGNSAAWTFRLFADAAKTTRFDLAGSTLVFRAVWPGGTLRKETPSGVVVATPANGEASVTLSAAETRSLPAGRVARFEMERRIGAEQRTLVAGFLSVLEGVNDE